MVLKRQLFAGELHVPTEGQGHQARWGETRVAGIHTAKSVLERTFTKVRALRICRWAPGNAGQIPTSAECLRRRKKQPESSGPNNTWGHTGPGEFALSLTRVGKRTVQAMGGLLRKRLLDSGAAVSITPKAVPAPH